MEEVRASSKKGLFTTALGNAAAGIDRAVVRAMQMRNARVRARAEALGHEERMRALEAIAAAYALYDLSPRAFFPEPEAITPRLDRVRRVGHVDVFDATWESRYEPYACDVRERYLSHANNRSARARLYLADT